MNEKKQQLIALAENARDAAVQLHNALDEVQLEDHGVLFFAARDLVSQINAHLPKIRKLNRSAWA